jgi:hypothetical protein
METAAMLLVVAVVGGLASSGLAINNDEIAAKGYRWVTVDGPYACVSKDDLRQIVKNRGTEAELQGIKQQRAYYLLQGDIVKVVREDPTSGLSLIRIAGVPKDLWTATKFLSKRPIENAFGVVETPETSGLILAGITRPQESMGSSVPNAGKSTRPTIQ